MAAASSRPKEQLSWFPHRRTNDPGNGLVSGVSGPPDLPGLCPITELDQTLRVRRPGLFEPPAVALIDWTVQEMDLFVHVVPLRQAPGLRVAQLGRAPLAPQCLAHKVIAREGVISA